MDPVGRLFPAPTSHGLKSMGRNITGTALGEAQDAQTTAGALAVEEIPTLELNRGVFSREKQPFVVTCLPAILPRNIKYTNVEFKHPDKPDDFRVLMDDSAYTNFSTVKNGGARIHWQISGDEWPYGPEADAKAWPGGGTDDLTGRHLGFVP